MVKYKFNNKKLTIPRILNRDFNFGLRRFVDVTAKHRFIVIIDGSIQSLFQAFMLKGQLQNSRVKFRIHFLIFENSPFIINNNDNVFKFLEFLDFEDSYEIISDISDIDLFSSNFYQIISQKYQKLDSCIEYILSPLDSHSLTHYFLDFIFRRGEIPSFICYARKHNLVFPLLNLFWTDAEKFLPKIYEHFELPEEVTFGEFNFYSQEVQEFVTLSHENNRSYNIRGVTTSLTSILAYKEEDIDDYWVNWADYDLIMERLHTICSSEYFERDELPPVPLDVIARIILGFKSFKMIEISNDEPIHISLGLSGGKDSVAMLHFLDCVRLLQPHFADIYQPFELHATVFDPGLPGFDSKRSQQHAIPLKMDSSIVHCPVGELAPEKLQKVETLCAFCSRMRRGYLYSHCINNHYQFLALGHHLMDAVETLMMNLNCCGGLRTIRGRYTGNSKNGTVEVIRPLMLVQVESILEFISENNIKTSSEIDRECDLVSRARNDSFRGPKERQRLADCFSKIKQTIPQVEKNIAKAMEPVLFFDWSQVESDAVDHLKDDWETQRKLGLTEIEDF
eukprot:TRINITY_DN9274_c0_g1_i1.p1 TRINITY_DN9274_c0_g1~~TRINITY_DN9274_c0_g1_i1.p1  ORF type:complete len:565 (+),score=130.90 TRINITY_DN9274_c0_g1_i1:78-1772(+)